MFSSALVEPVSKRAAIRHASAPELRAVHSDSHSADHSHASCACGGGCPRCAAPLHEARVEDALAGRAGAENPRDSHPEQDPIPLDAPGRNRAPADDARDCLNGGGSSFCNPETGNYDIEPSTNTCCTKECTELHEAEHRRDMDGWGCCKDFSERVVPARDNGGDVQCFVDTFKRWLDVVTPLTECHAYRVSVNCADRLSREKRCDTDAGRRTVCCQKIKQYRDGMEAKRRESCNAAPRQAPPCPHYDRCRTTAPAPAPPAPPARPASPARGH
jgi:hypothetical protein